MRSSSKKLLSIFIVVALLFGFVPTTVEAKALTNNSYAAYAWILLEAKYQGESINVNKIYIGKDKEDGDSLIIINYTYKNQKKYASIKTFEGEAEADSMIPVFQLECDDLKNKYLVLNTFSSKEDLEYSFKIGKSLKTADVKKLYKKYKSAENYSIVS